MLQIDVPVVREELLRQRCFAPLARASDTDNRHPGSQRADFVGKKSRYPAAKTAISSQIRNVVSDL
jgi:hypothetical protein